MEDSGEELAFVVEDAKESIIVPAIEAVLKDQDFDQVKVDQWTDTICESTMKGLVDLQKPFKYIGQLLFVFVCLVYPLLCAKNTHLFCHCYSLSFYRSHMSYHAKEWGRCIFSQLLFF